MSSRAILCRTMLFCDIEPCIFCVEPDIFVSSECYSTLSIPNNFSTPLWNYIKHELWLRFHLFSSRFWNVRGVPEAAKLAGVLALAYLCLEIPHVYPGPGSLTHFFVHVAHKFTLVFIMALVLWGYRRYVEKKNY